MERTPASSTSTLRSVYHLLVTRIGSTSLEQTDLRVWKLRLSIRWQTRTAQNPDVVLKVRDRHVGGAALLLRLENFMADLPVERRRYSSQGRPHYIAFAEALGGEYRVEKRLFVHPRGMFTWYFLPNQK